MSLGVFSSTKGVIKMKGKDKKLIAVLVVPVVIIAAVAGYYLYPVEEPLRIDEGYAEIWLEYLPGPDEGETYYDKNVTATTYVDGNDNWLEFEVIPLSSSSDTDYQYVRFTLVTNGHFESTYSPQELLFIVKGLDGPDVYNNHQDFLLSGLNISNLTLWPNPMQNTGSRGSVEAFNGFDVDENEFYAEVELRWRIPRENWNKNYTLRLESTVRGMSEDVTSTIDVHIMEVEG